jgi:hypothetical protein
LAIVLQAVWQYGGGGSRIDGFANPGSGLGWTINFELQILTSTK